MDLTVELTEARAAHARGDWATTYAALSRARAEAELAPADLALLGGAAWWVGRAQESLALTEAAFRQLEDAGDGAGAAARAVDLALVWFTRGDLVVTNGWLQRARRLLAGLPESATHGYLGYLDGALALFGGDVPAGRAAGDDLDLLARRLREPGLTSLGLVLAGLADLRDGRTAGGFAQLDEAMLPVLAGRLPPEWAGEVYCTVIHACHQLGDLERMRAWTRATERWCEQFRGEVVFSGICRVHRLQLRCAEGGGAGAEDAVARSGAELEGVNDWVAGEAFYQLGELRRLRGDRDGARAAYARARALDADPQPGEALLLLAGGDRIGAWSGLTGALAGRDRLGGARLLAAGVHVALALGRRDEAERWSTRLGEVAAEFGTPGFRGWAAHAEGAVHVARGRFGEAVDRLETAAREYRALHLRYETAQVYELLAEAHAGAGRDAEAAADRATAVAIYREVGALPDVRRLDDRGLPGGLTDREGEVLGRVAAGLSNRQVARDLVISEKTVSRHLANIFVKIGVSSRTAAAAWAHEHGVRAPG